MADPQKYTVGWICAITTESVAARAFLDEEHDGRCQVAQHDNNSYVLGKIGSHNVVIAVLPDAEYGIASAAAVARDMLHSFPNVRIGLMVGIGGGAPSRKHDVRLGDVVVSSRGGGKGGVFQYDFGKTIQNQSFQETGFLDQPPMVLRAAMSTLRGTYEMKGHQLVDNVDKALQKIKQRKKYTRPPPASDRLYKPDIVHASHSFDGCDVICGNDEAYLVVRDERDEEEDDPAIHYGLIASGNQLMKDARIRDKLADDKGVLCFEMEAAGLMNHFPCLVIRGICDYSDSHKNKEWQGFAAMMAAAYAKDILHQIPPNKVEAERRIGEILRSVEEELQYIRPTISNMHARVDSLTSDSHLDKLKTWLSPPDPSTNRNAAKEKRQEGTGNWFVTSTAFNKWKSGSRRHLWLHGLAGCGKTVLTSAILDHLQGTQTDSSVCLDFFFDFRDKDKQHLDNLLRSLAFQLYSRCPDSQKELDSLLTLYKDGQEQPTTKSLSQIVHLMMQRPPRLQIILDALDECTTRRELLKWMETLAGSEFTNIHLLATSRREEELESGLGEWIERENMMPIDKDLVNHDIRSYTKARLQSSKEFQKRWGSRPDVLQDIESVIEEKSHGMFRWAACQLDNLERCLDYDELQRALHSLPQDLSETYSRILTSIPEGRREKTVRILQFLTYSERPLAVGEAVDAIAIRLDPHGEFDTKYRLPCPSEITRFCPSLVSLVTTESARETATELELAHFSVKEYLTSEKVPEPFRHRFSEANSRGYITQSCLAYLASLRAGESFHDIDDQFPLARYSAEYWMDHAKAAETSNNVRDSIIDFFQNNTAYTSWSRLFNPDHPRSKYPEPNTTCPLYFASLKGLNVIVQTLLKKGADVNAQGGKYGNALQAASFEGHDKVVQMLLVKGADVNARGGDHGNALYAASLGGHDKVVQLLLEKGADVNAQGGWFHKALHAASVRGHYKVIQMLLEKGADMNAQSGHDGTVLYAASFGHDKVIQLLLEKGADLNAQSGCNALYAASDRGHNKVVQMLLEKGVDVDAQGGNSSNALQAASFGGHDKVIQMLLEMGADVNAQGGDYGNALQAASFRGHDKVIQMLLEMGADVNAQGGDYGNVLQAASFRGHDKVIQMLLEMGADVNAQGGKYGNALQAASFGGHAASFGGHDKVIQMLLEMGADVNAQGGDYGNALQAASFRGNNKVIQMLLEMGADVNAQGGKCGNALRAALAEGHDKIIQLLLEKGANW
ncbi:ankyrin repeat protein [Lasiosphaeria hispida]|uniref:Ankyrin repeat protein n=1 Tax=Lasiosphaeria hispida TaxID=260671 RepID=A0AAJ0HWD4_9PEZI|nr:ankyrin repeat protein [Lasiosphaeria hispida]